MHIREQKLPKQWRERSSPKPRPDWVEEEFAVTIRVPFPTTDFIVDSQRDLLLELVLMIGGISGDPVGALQSETHVEILGNVVFGPVHQVIRIACVDGDVLESFPSDKGIVTNERRNFAVADLEPDLSVAHLGEIGGAVFEEVAGDLIDACVMLNDCDFRGEKHLGGTIDETIPGLRTLISRHFVN
jgi:hypothetical protein